MDFGQVGEVREENGIFRVKWRIENFFSLSEEVDSFCVSSHFYIMNTRWFLRMFPNGQTDHSSQGWIGLYLMRSVKGPPICVNLAFAARSADGEDIHCYVGERNIRFSEEHSVHGASQFLKRSELLIEKPRFVPSDALTIVCTMWSDELPSSEDERLVSREAQTEDLAGGEATEEHPTDLDMKGEAILRKHFQDLLLDGKDYDVTLKVNDQEFGAHKNILRARSPVFAAMFPHNMTENECGDVCIEDCDPGAFGEFLKYVYVGKLENMSPNTATGLYYAADKYDFPDLKETCVQFLKASLTTNVISDVIVLATKHNEQELLKCAMEFFSKQIIEILMTVEWQRFIASNPGLSNELTVKAMKISRKSTE